MSRHGRRGGAGTNNTGESQVKAMKTKESENKLPPGWGYALSKNSMEIGDEQSLEDKIEEIINLARAARRSNQCGNAQGAKIILTEIMIALSEHKNG